MVSFFETYPGNDAEPVHVTALVVNSSTVSERGTPIVSLYEKDASIPSATVLGSNNSKVNILLPSTS